MVKIERTPTLTIEELAKKNAALEKQNEALLAKLNWLEAQFRLSQQKQFGASSEKTNKDQLALSLDDNHIKQLITLALAHKKEMNVNV